MFHPKSPPLLAQPIKKEHVSLFPENEGFQVQAISDERALVGFKGGWILPLSVEQRACIVDPPVLVVRDSGRVTKSSSTGTKGFAHMFCTETGETPQAAFTKILFPEQNENVWLFVEDTVTMIWFQYGNKNQVLGSSGYDMERIYYGKLLIRKFSIKEDMAPGFDKFADYIYRSASLLRVESQQVYLGGWSVNNESPGYYLKQLLTANNLSTYRTAVEKAISVACGE